MKTSNERYQQIIDEAYENYNEDVLRLRELQKKEVQRLRNMGILVKVSLIELLRKEEFINKIKTDEVFAKMWDLKIEERVLTLEERNDYYTSHYLGLDCESHEELNKLGDIPTKLITITYKEQTIESYE